MTIAAGQPVLRVAPWTRQLTSSPLHRMLHEVHPRISLALGCPAPELMPALEIGQAAERLLRDDRSALQYGPPPAELKECVVELVRWRGVRCEAAQVLLTTGAQQALSLLATLLLAPGDPLICEEVAYTGFQQAIAPLTPRIVTVPSSNDHGLDLDALESLLDEGLRPGFVYVVPDGHNPLGVSMPPDRRRRLAAIATRHGIAVVEDDAYGLLQYEPDAWPVIRSLEDEYTFYVGSFSKILSPALRVGWIVAAEPMVTRLAAIKEGADINTATLAEHVICAYVRSADLAAHVERLKCGYRRRRDAMIDALERTFPPGARWTVPRSGFFVWVDLPESCDPLELLRRALHEDGVAFFPGSAFAVEGSLRGRRAIRLNLSYSSVDQIREGVALLSRHLHT